LDGYSPVRVAVWICEGQVRTTREEEKCARKSWSEILISRSSIEIYGLYSLQLFEELARRARDIDSAGSAALAIFHAFDDARGLAALGTIGALAGVHYFFTVRGFCNFRSYCHESFLLILIA
jgi:hypothetical protein